jgi:TnpA family transposase
VVRFARTGPRPGELLAAIPAELVRLCTASTEALLRRFTSETTHPAYAAMLEGGRAQRSIFLAR